MNDTPFAEGSKNGGRESHPPIQGRPGITIPIPARKIGPKLDSATFNNEPFPPFEQRATKPVLTQPPKGRGLEGEGMGYRGYKDMYKKGIFDDTLNDQPGTNAGAKYSPDPTNPSGPPDMGGDNGIQGSSLGREQNQSPVDPEKAALEKILFEAKRSKMGDKNDPKWYLKNDPNISVEPTKVRQGPESFSDRDAMLNDMKELGQGKDASNPAVDEEFYQKARRPTPGRKNFNGQTISKELEAQGHNDLQRSQMNQEEIDVGPYDERFHPELARQRALRKKAGIK
jgi:hypothetical protein